MGVTHITFHINLIFCTQDTFRLSGMTGQFVSIAAACMVAEVEEDRVRGRMRLMSGTFAGARAAINQSRCFFRLN